MTVNNTTTKPMSNKKETPVNWLVEQFALTSDPTFIKVVTEHALEMESKKQQKYDEMLAMLERFLDREYLFREMEQLIKEAKEL
jgi:hypothetical protein